jgi:tetratricopeptide (TPR) repeat protein
MYAEALVEAGDLDGAAAAVTEGLAHVRAPRLVMRQALVAIARGDRATGEALMREAAAGEPRAMSNLALLRLEDGNPTEALALATRAAAALPLFAPAQRALGKIALAAQHPDQALPAFTRAVTLEPANLANRYNLALALIALRRGAEARPHLEACLADPGLGARARSAIAALDRGAP